MASRGRTGPLTQDKIERAHGDALRRALVEKEEEIRRLRDAAERELRTRAEEKDRELRRLKEDAELREKAERDRRMQEDAAFNTKAEMEKTHAPEGPAPSIHLDEALARARRRLFRWGAVATLLFAAAAVALLVLKGFLAW